MEHKTERYGLMTSITMIIGVCIGSGIFFKSDNILAGTNGSVALGVLAFVLGAIAIIFGGLTLGELAARTNKAGGVVTYAEEFTGKRSACAFGWFQTLIYYPSITIVVSWVVGVYTCILFNLEGTFTTQMSIGLAFCTLCFIYNTLAPKFGSAMQNTSTIIKLIPLFLLGICGMIWGDPISGIAKIEPGVFASTGWLAAIGPIAYSFDGWTVSTSISHEVKNAKKNMPRALMIAPIIILLIYVLYFVGITSYLTPATVMELGDGAVTAVATQLFGVGFAKAITVFVIIAVMGTVNGLVMGFIRMPYSLAIRKGMVPFEKQLSKMNDNLKMPINSAIAAFALCIVWMIVHAITMTNSLLPNSDVSEISIAISYILYVVLYVRVFWMYKKGEIKSVWRGVVCPVLACVGSCIIITGGLQNKLFLYYVLFCAVVIAISQLYFSRRAAKQ